MTEKENRLDKENDLRKGAEEIVREETARLPENPETLPFEETTRVLHDLRVYQIELEMQNDELRRTQDELNAARLRYFDLYDLAPVGYVTVSKQGLILEANFTAAALLGTARNALVKQPLSRFIFKEDEDIYYLYRKQLFETGVPQTCELRMARRDETIFRARLEAAVSQDADGGPVSRVVLSDVTEHNAAEETMRESEAELQAIFNTVGTGILIIDKNTQIIIEANRTAVEMTGLPKERIIGQVCHSLVCPAQAGKCPVKDLGQCVDHSERKLLCADGHQKDILKTVYPISIKGRDCYVESFIDISDRKQTEAALQKSEEKYRNIFNDAILGIYQTTPDGRILSANPALAKMYGYDTSEELTNHVTAAQMYVNPEDREIFKRILSKEGVVKKFETRFRTKGGEIIWVSINGHVVKDAQGIISSFEGTIEDITNRKQTEEVLAFLAQSSGAKSGEGFFELLASYLAKSLGMDFICIDYLEGDGLTARTVAVWCDGKFEDNVTYALKDTPCGEVVGKTVCCFPASVCTFFPRDEVLVELRAESYVGVTLWSYTGKPIGLIAVIGRRPLVNRELAETILKMVAVRAAGEMERLMAEIQIKSLLSEKELLLREVHHRIKNNMSVIMSLLSLQSDALHDPSAVAALEGAGNRVRSMMVLYDKLYRSSDFRELSAKEYLTSLVDEIVINFPNHESVTVEKQIDDCILDAKTLSPVGMILNELLTNTMKHAFPEQGSRGEESSEFGVRSRQDKRIIIALRTREDLAVLPDSLLETPNSELRTFAKQITLSVSDNGIGIPESIDIANTTGFGLQLVSILTEQLEGTIRIERENGTRFVLEFEKQGQAGE